MTPLDISMPNITSRAPGGSGSSLFLNVISLAEMAEAERETDDPNQIHQPCGRAYVGRKVAGTSTAMLASNVRNGVTGMLIYGNAGAGSVMSNAIAAGFQSLVVSTIYVASQRGAYATITVEEINQLKEAGVVFGLFAGALMALAAGAIKVVYGRSKLTKYAVVWGFRLGYSPCQNSRQRMIE
jgi:hypothetical protein